MKKAMVVLLGACMMAQAAGTNYSAAADTVPEAEKGDIVLLYTNDSHGRADDNMGFASAAALKDYYEVLGATVLLVDAGDTLHGLPFATIENGGSIVEVMNLAGYDVMTPGNHDFNYGSEHLLELREEMQFELVSANIFNKEDGSYFIAPYTIIERNGETFGFFGLSTPETTYKTSPENVETLDFTDPVAAAEQMTEYLKEREVDHIIAVSHLGTDASSVFTSEMVAEQVEGIELIIDGHSHTVYENGYQAGGTLIVSTGEYIENIGVVVLHDGNYTAGLVSADEFSGKDEAVVQLIADITARQDIVLSETAGSCEVTLDGERGTNRTRETNLGNLTADAMRYVSGAEVAVTNGGGIRATIEAGDITRKDLVAVFPFGNYVVTKELTGAELLSALENGVKAYPEPLGGFPQVSGITFTFDESREAGNRISEVKINGRKLDFEKKYLVATNNFIAAGGDEYTMFADKKIVNEFASLEEVVLAYLQENGEIPEIEGRINVINTAADTGLKEEESKGQDAGKNQETGAPAKEQNWYVVAKGDYLRKIAARFYHSESCWKKIYEVNRNIIKNPDFIYAGMKLLIP